MAIMIPAEPKQHDVRSREAEVFAAFKRNLPNDYYVFHSLSYYINQGKGLNEGEVDFLIFHPNKGLLFLEVKAGAVVYQYGYWCYSDGSVMKHGGPLQQALHSKWAIFDYFHRRGYGALAQKCKFIHAACFPSISRKQLNTINTPPEVDKNLILTSDDLFAPKDALERIFSHQLCSQIETSLTSREAQLIIDKVLAPSFHLSPMVSTQLENDKHIFVRLIKDQARILDYLEEERNAAINGVAGSGKTLIALQKAKQHADRSEKVLFLCFNNNLQNYLREHYHAYRGTIDFYTIDALAVAICKSNTVPDLVQLGELIMDQFCAGSFPYKHIIIDEGQDFGQERIERSGVINTLKECVLSEDVGGSFYAFYDKNQLIQGYQLPSFLSTAACRFCLKINCRNTENIACTSLRSIVKKAEPKMIESALKGELCELSIVDHISQIQVALHLHLDTLIQEKFTDIVILTVETEHRSSLASQIIDSKYHYRGKDFTFNTCRKFKGLEADAVILIDVSKNSFETQNARVLYVGASRAKLRLGIIALMSEQDCRDILDNNKSLSLKRLHHTVATKINAVLKN